DLFVVKLTERVDGDTFKELRNRAKQLGGYYSQYRGGGAIPGFQFTNESDAKSFMAVREGDVDGAGIVEVKAEEREGKAVNKLRALAERIQEDAESRLNADRKTNTARRAAMAS